MDRQQKVLQVWIQAFQTKAESQQGLQYRFMVGCILDLWSGGAISHEEYRRRTGLEPQPPIEGDIEFEEKDLEASKDLSSSR
jgi:hypothetical protein